MTLAVAPHLDDAILSVGAHLSKRAPLARVVIATALAGVPDTTSRAASHYHTLAGLPDGPGAVRRRRAEDLAACAIVGARAIHGAGLDAIYRRNPAGGWSVEVPTEVLTRPPPSDPALVDGIEAWIDRLLVDLRPDDLLTCAGIGQHMDHLLVRDYVVAAARRHDIRVELWEDLPYAMQYGSDDAWSWRRLTSPPEAWERKWRALAAYESQVRMLWPGDTGARGELERYATAVGEAGEPVERVAIVPS